MLLNVPATLCDRGNDGKSTFAGDERNFGSLRHGRHCQRNAAHVAAAHDELDLILADQAAGRSYGFLGLAFGIVKGPGDLSPVDPAGSVDLVDRELEAGLHVFAEKGRRPGDRQDRADAKRFFRRTRGPHFRRCKGTGNKLKKLTSSEPHDSLLHFTGTCLPGAADLSRARNSARQSS